LPYQVSQATIAAMSTLVVSSMGQIVLPASTRRRLGLDAGSMLEVLHEGDGVRLRVVGSAPKTDLADRRLVKRAAGLALAQKVERLT
jgi:antitoxin PrlF